jgi:hypothetical protein
MFQDLRMIRVGRKIRHMSQLTPTSHSAGCNTWRLQGH